MNQTISIGKFPIEINHLKILCHFFESNEPKRLLSSSVRICNFVKVDRSHVWLGSGPESRLQERAYCSTTYLMKSSFTREKKYICVQPTSTCFRDLSSTQVCSPSYHFPISHSAFPLCMKRKDGIINPQESQEIC